MNVLEMLKRHNNNTLDVIMPGNPPISQEKDVTSLLTELEDKLEFLGSAGGFALTITFKDYILSKFKRDALIGFIREMLSRKKDIQGAILISDYSDTGRFHLHGVVRVKNLHTIENIRKQCYRDFGITKAKIIDNSVKWAEYCTQQYTDDGKDGVKISTNKLKYIRIKI